MKGIINRGIQEMVEASYGTEIWENIKCLAGCEEPFFAVSLDYPDGMTFALVKAVSDVSGMPVETVLAEYGKYVVQHTLKKHYPTYFTLAGTSPREFLLSRERIHSQATPRISKAAPPKFTYEELPDGRLLIHYDSSRKLCAVLRGLILGVGMLFRQELEVRETTCMHKGDRQCTVEVTFP